ncbi:MAG: c-type cytochrome, partial [Pelobacteraceae bacterium]
CSTLFVSICFLAGCSKEAPQKADVSVPAPASPQAASSLPGAGQTGEVLFKQFCSSCHPDGGNVSDPARTLHGDALRKNSITTADDIVRIMRNPGARMIRFDAATVSDRDAHIIADYVLKTFK